MKVQFIIPASAKPAPLYFWHKNPAKRKAPWPALGLPILASVTSPGVSMSIVDDNFDKIDFSKTIDLVAINTLTATAPRAYEIADRFRENGVKVVLGGMHATAIPEEAAAHADAVMLGEADHIWPQIVNDMRDGGLNKVYRCDVPPSLVGMPMPRRDLLNKNRYLTLNSVQVSRGCVYSCDFCYVREFHGYSHRTRLLEDVIAEVKSVKGNLVFFVDDNIIGHISYAKELFKSLIPLKKRWVGQASLNMGYDEELLELMARSGCQGLLIGLESVVPENLKAINKSVNKVAAYESLVEKIHSFGIALMPSIVFGFDHDGPDVFERTLRFIEQVHFEMPFFAILTPLPGTGLFYQLEKEGRIIERDWRKYDFLHVVFKPKLMTPQQLKEGVGWIWNQCFSIKAITKRNNYFFHRLVKHHYRFQPKWRIPLNSVLYFQMLGTLRTYAKSLAQDNS